MQIEEIIPRVARSVAGLVSGPVLNRAETHLDLRPLGSLVAARREVLRARIWETLAWAGLSAAALASLVASAL